MSEKPGRRNAASAPRAAREARGVVEVAGHGLGAGGKGADAAGAGERADGDAGVRERANDGAADVPGRAGHEDRSGHLWSVPGASAPRKAGPGAAADPGDGEGPGGRRGPRLLAPRDEGSYLMKRISEYFGSGQSVVGDDPLQLVGDLADRRHRRHDRVLHVLGVLEHVVGLRVVALAVSSSPIRTTNSSTRPTTSAAIVARPVDSPAAPARRGSGPPPAAASSWRSRTSVSASMLIFATYCSTKTS